MMQKFVDMELLNKINLDKLPQDKMIYFGGVLRPLTFKDKNFDFDKVRSSFSKNKVNKIESKTFKIGNYAWIILSDCSIYKTIIRVLGIKRKIKGYRFRICYYTKEIA